jgi:chemotaxis methyl-accepting protein methylase
MTLALREVADLVQRESGIVIKDPQLPALEAALRRIEPGMDAGALLARVAKAGGREAVLGRLIDEVTVKETYFMREPRDLEAVDWRRLVQEAAARGADRARVWVAACATGEEAYSLAILASEALGPHASTASILATDISEAALERARAGVYSERAVRNVPPQLRDRYFTHDGNRYSIRDELKSLVRFGRHNLITDAVPPPGELRFDLIACRNVLIYFAAETVEHVIGSLESALRPEALLILGAADRLTGTAGRLGGLKLDRPAIAERRPRPAAKADRRRRGPRPRSASKSPHPRRRVEDRIEDALAAADRGNLGQALEITARVLTADPLQADAYFVHGLAELGLGDADAAANSLRRALYLDPSFWLAAFQLGRAHDIRGDRPAARRAYQQALRTLNPDDDRHRIILDQIDVGDIAAACSARLAPAVGG